MMKNVPCSKLTPEENDELLNAFPLSLTDWEEAAARSLFKPIVFYEAQPDRSRDCWCSTCRKRFNVPRRGNADFFRASHKRDGKRMRAKCPNCGTESDILAANKFSEEFKSLSENHQAVVLTVWNGWLLIRSGILLRDFLWDGPETGEEFLDCLRHRSRFVRDRFSFCESRRYAFRPGRRVEWRKLWQRRQDIWSGVTAADYRSGFTDSDAEYTVCWERTAGVGEAHPRRAYWTESAYYILGLEKLGESSMRYCGYLDWFRAAYGAMVDTEVSTCYAWLCTYLAEYSRRPQMEFLVKLDYTSAVSDLVIRREPNSALLDWKAQNPAAFFHMGGADFRVFQAHGGKTEDLRLFRELQGKQCVRDFREYAQYQDASGERIQDLCRCCEKAGVTLKQGAAYVQGQAGKLNQVPVRTWADSAEKSAEVLLAREAITLWSDYLDAARRLEYDLTLDDVKMPKNLTERHDAAVQTIHCEEDKEEKRKYARLYKRLVKRYEYEADGLKIVVPTCSSDIVNEGKLLHHCVGSYAPRHIGNKVTILFLRMESAPSAPYVTIEMTVDNNPSNVNIRQIHGYRNERDGALSPMAVHEAFLNRWLDWVHSGSPRDRDGRPAAPEAQCLRVSA